MPRSIYLRTVLGSRPVWRAIAATDSPCAASPKGRWLRFGLSPSAGLAFRRQGPQDRQQGKFQSPLSGIIAGPMTYAYRRTHNRNGADILICQSLRMCRQRIRPRLHGLGSSPSRLVGSDIVSAHFREGRAAAHGSGRYTAVIRCRITTWTAGCGVLGQLHRFPKDSLIVRGKIQQWRALSKPGGAP